MIDPSDPFRLAFLDMFAWVSLMLALPMLVGMAAIAIGNSRAKHCETELNLQLCLFGWMILFTYLFGLSVRQLFVDGPGITGSFGDASSAWPWSEGMGPLLVSNGTGSGLFRRIMESWLVSALVAASLVERVRGGSMFLLAAVAGLTSSICAAWMWSPDSWLVSLTGFHDAFGAATIHALAGGFALGVLQIVGSRVAATGDGRVLEIPPSIPWLLAFGRLMLTFGLMALAVSTLQPLVAFNVQDREVVGTASIFGTPASLFGVTTNLLLAVAAGILVGHVKCGGRIGGNLTGGIAGLVGVMAGADHYHPLQAFLIAAALAWASLSLQVRLRERGIDDPIGTVAIHGASAMLGLIVAGTVLWGYPATALAGSAIVNPFGNAVGAFLAFFALGYLPGYLAGRLLEFLDILRVPLLVEIGGSDLAMNATDAREITEVLERESLVVASALSSDVY